MPSVFHVVHVTNESPSVNDTGSLAWAYQRVTDTNHPDYENQARIIFDEGVDEVQLSGTLIGNTIPLTVLEFDTENNHEVTLIGNTDPNGAEFRFLDHIGNNGIAISMENLNFDSFEGVVVLAGPIEIDNGDGGTFRTNAPLSLSNCEFNGSISGGDGGAIKTFAAITLTGCEFEDCFADDNGGAIDSVPGSTTAGITITDCLFASNDAGGDGGAINFVTSSGTLTIAGDDTLFFENMCGGKGGAIFQSGGFINATSSSSADPLTSGFVGNRSNTGTNAEALHLTELFGATININFNDTSGPVVVHLFSTVPPSSPELKQVNLTRTPGLDSNWFN